MSRVGSLKIVVFCTPCSMDSTHINRLKEEQRKGLHLCEENILQWEKFKTDYETLKQRLESLPDALSYDVTVPFGKQAFAKGKVVHTNEVMVLLGDNWFTEVSSKQAAAITDRRIKQCTDKLRDFHKEKDQIHHWNKFIDEVSANDDLIEIVEKYDEEQEKQWREHHALRVREHRQRLARERRNSGGSTGSCSEEESFLQRLESLEESESQATRSGESDSSFFECSDEGSEEKRSPTKLQLDCNAAKGEEERMHGGDSSEGGECSSSPESAKHVRWQDLSKQNIKRITFRHTKNHIKNRHQQNNFAEGDEEEQTRLKSPSDIYRQFGAFFQSSPPKSILKVKHSPCSENDEPFRFEQLKLEENDCSQKAFTGEVRENSSPIHITQKKPRPVSHFKNSRKNRKK